MSEYILKKVTVRELIKILIDVYDIDEEIFIKDKEGIEIHPVTICSRKQEGLGCLFG